MKKDMASYKNTRYHQHTMLLSYILDGFTIFYIVSVCKPYLEDIKTGLCVKWEKGKIYKT